MLQSSECGELQQKSTCKKETMENLTKNRSSSFKLSLYFTGPNVRIHKFIRYRFMNAEYMSVDAAALGLVSGAANQAEKSPLRYVLAFYVVL